MSLEKYAMKFYDCSTAPSPRRARMFIAEKGMNIDTQEISIANGEQLSSAFLALNPGATVPVLVTDAGAVLTENLGIAAYLEAAQPEPALLGRSADEKGAVLMWNAIVEAQFGHAVADALRNGNPAMAGRALPGPVNYEQIPALAERGLARVDVFYDKLEARLQQVPWLAGQYFSLADITCFVFVEFSRVIRKRVPEANAASLDWYHRIKQRPSAQM
jgi:glutathione S-transferase